MKEIRQGNTFVEDCGLHEEGPMIENCALPSADGARVWELIARAGTLDWAERHSSSFLREAEIRDSENTQRHIRTSLAHIHKEHFE